MRSIIKKISTTQKEEVIFHIIMKAYIILLIIIYINDLKYFIVKIFILKKISNDTTKLQSLGDDLGLTTKHHLFVTVPFSLF